MGSIFAFLYLNRYSYMDENKYGLDSTEHFKEA